MSFLSNAQDYFVEAHYLLEKRLRIQYPLGSRLTFFIMYGQKNPSSGIAASYTPTVYGGLVRVLHEQAKLNSRYKYRDVPVKNILSVEEPK